LSNLVLEILKHDKIEGGQFALASPTPNSEGPVPRTPFTVIYAHGYYFVFSQREGHRSKRACLYVLLLL